MLKEGLNNNIHVMPTNLTLSATLSASNLIAPLNKPTNYQPRFPNLSHHRFPPIEQPPIYVLKVPYKLRA